MDPIACEGCGVCFDFCAEALAVFFGLLLLIKGWDSLDDGRARFTPHGAFDLPNTPEDAAPRESIEVRTLVVIEN